MATGKVYPDGGQFNSAPPLPGSYYNVKEQHLPAPATYRRGRRGRSGCCCFLSCLCSIFTILVILLVISTLIFWLAVHPRAPKFDVENVHISGLDNTSSSVNTNITYEIMARNPNKRIGIYYDDINLNVEANGMTIGEGSIPSFYQGHKNTTYLNGDITSQGLELSSETVALLTNNPTNVPLYAKVDVKARIKVGSIKSPKMTIKVRCDLNVDLTRTSGQLTRKHCRVKW